MIIGCVVTKPAFCVDVAVGSVDVAAEKETVVVPEASKKLNVQFPLPSVVVVASVESYTTVTIEEADVVPVKVTVVVPKSSFSLGERIERESGESVPCTTSSVFAVGLPPLAALEPPAEGVETADCGSVGAVLCGLVSSSQDSDWFGSSIGETAAPRTCGAGCCLV